MIEYDEDRYEKYINQLHVLRLNIFNDEDLKIFKKSKGKGQFILRLESDDKIIEERWEYYRFEREGADFKNFNKEDIIHCLPTYVDKENNLLNIPKDSTYRKNACYKAFDDVDINLPIEKEERDKHPFEVISSNIIENLDLKIGLYLQTESSKNLKIFEKDMNLLKNENFNILVFPETCFTSFTMDMRSKSIFNNIHQQDLIEKCLNLSKFINKAVVISTIDSNNVCFSIYANANASNNETVSRIYIKHTMTDNSPFIDEKYDEFIEELFTPIIYNGYSIGLTICYDCNHAPFSRMYGLQDVDLIINSTGGDVVYDKWYKYNKARAIENKCFNLVTMGGFEENKNKNFTYGFNPNGGLILPINMDGEEKPSKPGKVYIYDLSSCNLDSTPEKYLYQPQNPCKNVSFEIPVGNSEDVLNKSKCIKENMYVLSVGKFNVIFIIINGNDILKPEKVIPLVYDLELNEYENKKYVIINQHGKIDKSFYSDKLSIILKVRSIENFSAVILESDNINMCYQPTDNKRVQVVKDESNMYGIDLDRAGGPDSVWRETGDRMNKKWRNNFEKLLEFMVEKTS